MKSKKFMDKIRDSSLTAIARKGAKLRKDRSVFGDVIEVFDQDSEVIIIDLLENSFEVCKGSLCGYMSEIWINSNSSTSKFIKLKEIELRQRLTNNSSSYTSSQKKTKTNNYNRSTIKNIKA